MYISVGNEPHLMLLTFLKEELATAWYLKAQEGEQGLLCCTLVCWSRNACRACRCRVYFTQNRFKIITQNEDNIYITL